MQHYICITKPGHAASRLQRESQDNNIGEQFPQ
jgi:hypothetical protein